jgi:hypothetical protein
VAAEKSDPGGPAKSNRPPKNQLTITFDGIAADDGIGAFVPGRPHRVNLSRDDPYMARLIAVKDQQFAAEAILIIALQIFVHGMELHRIDQQDQSVGRSRFCCRKTQLNQKQAQPDALRPARAHLDRCRAADGDGHA